MWRFLMMIYSTRGLKIVVLLMLSLANSLASAQSERLIFAENLIEASILSKNYAKHENAIGVVIGYGYFKNAASPSEIGDRLVEEFEKLGENAKYFLAHMDKPGYTVSFDHASSGTEFIKPRDAVKRMQAFVEEKRRFEKLLSK